MVQQQLPATNRTDQIWQHMVAVIMLNQTGRKPVKTVLPLFLHKWPTAMRFHWSKPEEVKEVIWPLGMGNVRENRIRRMTSDMLNFWNFDDATELYGIGRYGSESYRIFFKGDRFEPQDKELRRYLGYPQLDKQSKHAIINYDN
jgi:endonuclease III